MTHGRPVPALPELRLELLEDVSPTQDPGFLRLLRYRMRVRYADGSASVPFVYDEVDRDALDAVVIVAHAVGASGEPEVYLRSALRPPVALLTRGAARGSAFDPHGRLWELPAGLVEPEEADGPRGAARRELEEELGFASQLSDLHELGPAVFPAPAFVAERHFFFEVRVNPALRRDPSLDGSPLEHEGAVVAVPLGEALALCRSGAIADSKTELGLRRLAERVA